MPRLKPWRKAGCSQQRSGYHLMRTRGRGWGKRRLQQTGHELESEISYIMGLSIRHLPWVQICLLACSAARGLPWWLGGKESACDAGDPGLMPGLGRSPGEGNGNPLRCSCLEDPMPGEPGGLYSTWGCKESDMTERQTLYGQCGEKSV